MRKFLKKLNKQKGITLIALIITVIVMLILVGVTIGGIFYDVTGIMSKITAAVNSAQIAEENEKIKLALNEYAIEKYMEKTNYLTFMKKKLEPNLVVANNLVPNNGDLVIVTFDKTNNAYSVSETGKIEKLNSEDVEIKDNLEGLSVGDYINYTPTSATVTVSKGIEGTGIDSDQTFSTEDGEVALKWRILSIDEAGVKLISESHTKNALMLKGVNGYNHSVEILNDICKNLYSNSNIGAISRNANIDDINALALSRFNPKVNPNFGFKYSISSDKKYPKIYEYEEGSTSEGLNGNGLQASDMAETGVKEGNLLRYLDTRYQGYNITSTLYCTNSFYMYNAETINREYEGLISIGSYYLLSSRCVSANEKNANFNIYFINPAGDVMSANLYDSEGTENSINCQYRPIVIIPANKTFVKDNEKSTSSVTYWNIEN